MRKSLRNRPQNATRRHAVDNAVASAYGGWPDRLYLIRRDGRIAYQGGEGPFGFKPDELEQAIERELG